MTRSKPQSTKTAPTGRSASTIPHHAEGVVPNPGSDAAIKMGCTCPVLDNCHGRGELLGRGFWMTTTCPIHGKKCEGP